MHCNSVHSQPVHFHHTFAVERCHALHVLPDSPVIKMTSQEVKKTNKNMLQTPHARLFSSSSFTSLNSVMSKSTLVATRTLALLPKCAGLGSDQGLVGRLMWWQRCLLLASIFRVSLTTIPVPLVGWWRGRRWWLTLLMALCQLCQHHQLLI